MGKKKTDEYNIAYDLYCNTEMNQKQIAGIAKVSPAQLGKWIDKDNWEIDKQAKSVTKEKLVVGFYQDIANIRKKAKEENRNLEPAETDQIVKLTTSINSLGKRYNLSNYHSVLKEMLEWLMQADNEKAKLFGPAMLEFLKVKSNDLKNAS